MEIGVIVAGKLALNVPDGCRIIENEEHNTDDCINEAWICQSYIDAIVANYDVLPDVILFTNSAIYNSYTFYVFNIAMHHIGEYVDFDGFLELGPDLAKVDNTFAKTLGMFCDEDCRYTKGQLFFATKKVIRRYTLDFWRSVKQYMQNNDQLPADQLWHVIFGVHERAANTRSVNVVISFGVNFLAELAMRSLPADEDIVLVHNGKQKETVLSFRETGNVVKTIDLQHQVGHSKAIDIILREPILSKYDYAILVDHDAFFNTEKYASVKRRLLRACGGAWAAVRPCLWSPFHTSPAIVVNIAKQWSSASWNEKLYEQYKTFQDGRSYDFYYDTGGRLISRLMAKNQVRWIDFDKDEYHHIGLWSGEKNREEIKTDVRKIIELCKRYSLTIDHCDISGVVRKASDYHCSIQRHLSICRPIS